MKLLRVTLSFVLLVFAWPIFAIEPAAQELDSQLKHLHSLQATFKQTIRSADDRILQQSTGTMALQRPGKFRWMVEDPNKQLIIANNDKLWIYDEDLSQLTIQSVAKSQNTPAFLLSDNNQNILKKFAITKIKLGEAEVKGFLLHPKQEDGLFTSLQLIFKQNRLSQIIMTDGLGQTTTIEFSKIKANAKLAAQLFSFNPPPGVEIIDNRS